MLQKITFPCTQTLLLGMHKQNKPGLASTPGSTLAPIKGGREPGTDSHVISGHHDVTSIIKNVMMQLWSHEIGLLKPVADLGFWKGGFQCARDWSHKVREARTLGGVAHGGHVPPGKFLISDLRLLLLSFWGKTPTANLVTVFETFKCLHNLKAWLRSLRGAGKIFS